MVSSFRKPSKGNDYFKATFVHNNWAKLGRPVMTDVPDIARGKPTNQCSCHPVHLTPIGGPQWHKEIKQICQYHKWRKEDIFG